MKVIWNGPANRKAKAKCDEFCLDFTLTLVLDVVQ